MLKKIAVSGMVIIPLLLVGTGAFAASAPVMGTAAGYAVLDANMPSATARADAQAAYNTLLAESCTNDLTGVDVNNQVYGPGVYCFSSSSFLNGQVTFDARQDANAVFIVKVNGPYTIASFSLVNLINGARPQNVFWQIAGPLNIGTQARLAGTFMARDTVNVGSDTIVDGRVWSMQGTVTQGSGTRIGFVPVPIPPVPAPAPSPTPPPAGTPAPTTGTIIVTSNTSDFALFVDGFRVMSGQPYVFQPGTHTVTEINLTSTEYVSPIYSGGCTQSGLVGLVTIAAGEQKTCVVTNLTGIGGVFDDLPGLPNTGGGNQYLPLVLGVGALLLLGVVAYKRQ